MAAKIWINGMGIVGRELFREIVRGGGGNTSDNNFEIVGINDWSLSPTEIADLLIHDTVATGRNNIFNRFVNGYTEVVGTNDTTKTTYKISTGAEISINYKSGKLSVGGKEIDVYQVFPTYWDALPLGESSVDIMVDCSGYYLNNSNSSAIVNGFIKFSNAGAKLVVSAYYSSNQLPSVVSSVNNSVITKDNIYYEIPHNLATHAISWLCSALSDLNIITEIRGTEMTAYTNAGLLQDGANSRSACYGINKMVDSGPFKSIGLIVPEYNGKCQGVSFTVPVVRGGIVNVDVLLNKDAKTDDINAALKVATNGSFGYVEDDFTNNDLLFADTPIVVKALPSSITYNAGSLMQIQMGYDNIWGLTKQTCNTLVQVKKTFG